MENFINIIFDNKEEIDDIVVSEVATMASPALLESETNYSLNESEDGKTVLTVANKLFDLGYNNFDIEVSV